MKKQNIRNFLITGCLFTAFLIYTAAVKFIDVRAIGPEGSSVGFGAVNSFVHNFTGVHMPLYVITDWLGLVPIAFAFGFAVLGLIQWIKRRSLFKVDYSLFVLGGFYILTITAYILFETVVINYRPVLIEGYLEVSYPSSTTMLVLCVMPTAVMQFYERIINPVLKRIVAFVISAFTVFMVIGRLISGVHWFTDIIGGILISGSLVMMYYSVNNIKRKSR